MKTIIIKITDNEYKAIKENADKWNQKIEDYLVITGRLYQELERKKDKLQIEINNLENQLENYEQIIYIQRTN